MRDYTEQKLFRVNIKFPYKPVYVIATGMDEALERVDKYLQNIYGSWVNYEWTSVDLVAADRSDTLAVMEKGEQDDN